MRQSRRHFQFPLPLQDVIRQVEIEAHQWAGIPPPAHLQQGGGGVGGQGGLVPAPSVSTGDSSMWLSSQRTESDGMASLGDRGDHY